jgi:hypothetical protein
MGKYSFYAEWFCFFTHGPAITGDHSPAWKYQFDENYSVRVDHFTGAHTYSFSCALAASPFTWFMSHFMLDKALSVGNPSG